MKVTRILLKANPMTMWLGIILDAIAFAATAFASSTADYIGSLGCFPPPDPREIGPISPDHSDRTKLLALP
jgi:hypothetical protein